MTEFDGYRYDQWKTATPREWDEEPEPEEPDWDAINDAAREDELAEKNDPDYWD